jgi:hypothetical protein
VLRRCLIGGVAAASLASVLIAGGASERAQAAPCPAPTVSNTGGVVSIQGTNPCDDDPEGFAVRCEAGTVRFDYVVNFIAVGPFDTTYSCAATTQLKVFGNYGGDNIDLTRVSAANGFTGISQPNLIDGGPQGDLLSGSPLRDSVVGGSGEDIVLLRDGAADSADCGSEIDAVQADYSGLDSLTNCEISDIAPAPVAAVKKCKKKGNARAAKKRRCKKHKKR